MGARDLDAASAAILLEQFMGEAARAEGEGR
jgi:hypothetical protein